MMPDEMEIVVGYEAERPYVAGSVLKDCRDCDVKLWFSPGSMAKILEGASPLCLRCAAKLVENADEPVTFGGFT